MINKRIYYYNHFKETHLMNNKIIYLLKKTHLMINNRIYLLKETYLMNNKITYLCIYLNKTT
jgi:hypothetical protein